MTARDALDDCIRSLRERASPPCAVVGGRTLRWGPEADGFSLELSFQLYQRPAGTRSVPVIPHVEVTAKPMASWRRSAGRPPERGSVFSCMLGQLSPRAQGHVWEIGTSNREQSVVDILRAVDRHARPLLALLRNPDSACEQLAHRLWGVLPSVPADINQPPVEYLLCFGRDDLVPRLLDSARRVPATRRELAQEPPPPWVELARRFLD